MPIPRHIFGCRRGVISVKIGFEFTVEEFLIFCLVMSNLGLALYLGR